MYIFDYLIVNIFKNKLSLQILHLALSPFLNQKMIIFFELNISALKWALNYIL